MRTYKRFGVYQINKKLYLFYTKFLLFQVFLFRCTKSSINWDASFSPIDSENRRLSVDERKEYKITTISMTTIFVAIYGVLLYAEFRIYAICITEGIILTAMLQIPCIVVKLWRVCREEKDQKNVNIVVSSKSD